MDVILLVIIILLIIFIRQQNKNQDYSIVIKRLDRLEHLMESWSRCLEGSLKTHNQKINAIGSKVTHQLESMKKDLASYQNILYHLRRLTSCVCQQFAKERLFVMVEDLLTKFADPYCQEITEMSSVDLPKPIKGPLIEDLLHRILSEEFAVVTHTGRKIAHPDLEVSENDIVLAVECKGWHFDVDTVNIRKFIRYMANPRYQIGIMVNFDVGKFIYDQRELVGLVRLNHKYVYFITNLRSDLLRLNHAAKQLFSLVRSSDQSIPEINIP